MPVLFQGNISAVYYRVFFEHGVPTKEKNLEKLGAEHCKHLTQVNHSETDQFKFYIIGVFFLLYISEI